MYGRMATVLVLTTLVVNLGCSQRQLRQKEPNLRRSLLVIRGEIEQFTLDHHRPPTSLSELVTSGYMKQIPADPFTGRNDKWRVDKRGDALEVHCGSDAVANDGTRYSSW
jgi:general secretion pathway protein G